MANFTPKEVSKLISFLKKGMKNGIHAADLAGLMGYSTAPNQEELRELIRYAIDRGELIGSTPHHGYWLFASLSEVEEVLDSLEGRAQGVCDRRNALLDSWNAKKPKSKSSRSHVDVKP